MIDELKKCPFCGGEAKTVENNHYTDMWSVICKHCYSETDRYHTKESTIEAWNRRKVGEWIPISEGLPKDAFGCLVTVIDTNPCSLDDFENILPYFVGYDGETWNDEDGKTIPFEVIAWMPLPEPYKESEEE